MTFYILLFSLSLSLSLSLFLSLSLSQAHESTSVEYEKILKDLQTLNALSDSNKLLRDENKSLQEKVSWFILVGIC